MSKKSGPKLDLPQPIPEVQATPPAPEVSLPQPPVYKFWNKSRCPRCGGLDTEAYATQGEIQSRVCRAPTCRNRFKVHGEPA